MDRRQHMGGRKAEPRPCWKPGPPLRWAEIDPDEAASFAHRIGPRAEAVLEFRVGDIRRFHHGSVDREFPAVIDAANAAPLDAPERQRCAAMTARLVEEAGFAVG